MALKYKCLILDHDDTAVDSTALIHYPAHLETMRRLRPEHKPIDLDGWFLKNFHPGIMAYLTEELKMNGRELELEYQIWREFTTSRVPRFYPGFVEALMRYREQGGTITVVSHSEKDVIEGNYGAFVPDLIFGWDYDAEKRKPSPWPVREILKRFGLEAEEALIVDDLKPGVLMSRATGVPAVAAGWSHNIHQIRSFMKAHCLKFLETTEEFMDFILLNEAG